MSSQPLSPGDDAALPGTSLRSFDRHVRVALSPLVTTTSLTIEATGVDRGSPKDWPDAVRAELEPIDLTLLSGVAETAFIPDCLLPRPEVYAPTFEEELEQIASTPPERLASEIWEEGAIETSWGMAARAPRRWLRAYVAALARAWRGTTPIWRRATPLLERETERIGTAVVRGAFDVVLDGLHPRGHVRNDRLYMDYGDGVPASIANGMVLAPVIGGEEAGFVAHRDWELTDMAYPLPGVRRLCGTGPVDASPGPSTLDALVGEPRAAVLRRLDSPSNGRGLAKLLQLAPSAVAHHLDALERAGLVRRERQGRNVLVHRTSRGSGLVALYE